MSLLCFGYKHFTNIQSSKELKVCSLAISVFTWHFKWNILSVVWKGLERKFCLKPVLKFINAYEWFFKRWENCICRYSQTPHENFNRTLIFMFQHFTLPSLYHKKIGKPLSDCLWLFLSMGYPILSLAIKKTSCMKVIVQLICCSWENCMIYNSSCTGAHSQRLINKLSNLA